MVTLTKDQVMFYESEGYLVLEAFASQEECKTLMDQMEALLCGFEPANWTIFSTTKKSHITDPYFMDSANNISFFFEERAFDDKGELKQPKELSINKVGHALHDQDPVFKKFSYSPKICDVLRSLDYRKPVLIQSMYIFKQPGIGGEVVPHQDSTYLYTEPPSVIGLWLALENASQENGCLWVLPKSHKGEIKKRYLQVEGRARDVGEAPTYDYNNFLPLEVKACTLVLLHGSLVHQSFENRSPKSRHAYTVHAIETDNCLWDANNWLQRKEFPLPLFVA